MGVVIMEHQLASSMGSTWGSGFRAIERVAKDQLGRNRKPTLETGL